MQTDPQVTRGTRGGEEQAPLACSLGQGGPAPHLRGSHGSLAGQSAHPSSKSVFQITCNAIPIHHASPLGVSPNVAAAWSSVCDLVHEEPHSTKFSQLFTNYFIFKNSYLS